MAWPRNQQAWLLSWKAFAVLTLFGLISTIFNNVYLHSMLKSQDSVKEPDFHEELFHSPDVFKVNYAEMEKNFKVYLNEKENPFETIPQWHEEKYQREIFFWNSIRNTHFGFRHLYVKPHMHFIPYPLLQWGNLGMETERAEDEVDDNKKLYYGYYWKRTLGADHFYMSCGDAITFPAKIGRFLAKNSIRVVCSASYNDSKYYPHKDFTIPYLIPEFASPAAGIDLKNRRTKLFFWVGNPESNLPEELRGMWENDKEVEIRSNSSDEHISTSEDLYSMQFLSAKYCICPRDHDVYDIYIALAIHYGCVPVILSDHYALPFSDILDWSKFSVILVEADVFRLKEILKAIPFSKYKKLQSNVVKVQRHFQWNEEPKNYDAFHLTMYELWLRRHATHY